MPRAVRGAREIPLQKDAPRIFLRETRIARPADIVIAARRIFRSKAPPG
jgi:hypothetical protein